LLRRRRAGAPPRRSLTPLPDADADADDDGAPPGVPAAHATPDTWGEVRVWAALEEVAHLDAAAEAGVERAAAQTCLALLSRPGGIFLDVKSAYSSAADIQLFAGALAGLGVHVKAVLSFRRRQLDGAPRLAARAVAPAVRLFHGLAGLRGLRTGQQDGLLAAEFRAAAVVGKLE
jgi:hypothetical protein